jgi:hypothetical protein
MERLGLVVYYGLLQYICPQISGVERGGGHRQQPVYTRVVLKSIPENSDKIEDTSWTSA